MTTIAKQEILATYLEMLAQEIRNCNLEYKSGEINLSKPKDGKTKLISSLELIVCGDSVVMDYEVR